MKKLLAKGKKILKAKTIMDKGQKSLDVVKLFRYIKKFISNMGQKVVYSILLMYYAYKRSDTPSWAKNIIMGTMAYVLSPLDALPDLAPLFGFTDDLGVLSFGLVTIACYINGEVREKSIAHMEKWSIDIDAKVIAEVDSTL